MGRRIQDVEISTYQVAEVLGCSRQNVQTYVKRRKLIPKSKKAGGKGGGYRFAVAELAKVMPANKYAELLKKLEDALKA